jgi:hypothetical protein
MAVTVRMKMMGTDPRPGLEAPNIGKICQSQLKTHAKSREWPYTENNNEHEVDVGDIVELKPQILWHET